MSAISPGRDAEAAHLRCDIETSLLRHDEHLAVRVEEDAAHRRVGGVDMDGDAMLGERASGSGHGDEAGHEVRGRLGDGAGVPAQAVWVGGRERAAEMALVGEAQIGPVRGRGVDAVEPGPARLAAWHGEGGTGELLRVETEWRTLGGVAADRQRAGQRLGSEFVAEAAEGRGRVGDAVHGFLRGRAGHTSIYPPRSRQTSPL